MDPARLHADDELLALRRRVEELGKALVAQQELHGFFTQAGLPMVILTGPEHRFALANPPYERMVGRGVLGKAVREAFSEDEVGQFFPILDRVYRTGEPFVGRELPLRLPDARGVLAERWVTVSYYPFRGPQGAVEGILAIHVDVTDEVLARRTLEEKICELAKERDLREHFVAALTHDLRRPLNNAKLGVEVLLRTAHDGEAARAVARRMAANLDRADVMIRDLLDANRIKAGDGLPISVQACRLDQLVAAVVKGMHDSGEQRVRLVNEAGACAGWWDERALQRVVENLAGNALKYGDPRAPVTITLRPPDDAVELAVHNEGPPIPDDEQRQLFQLYRRPAASRAGPQSGWGIGLTLVKGIAEAHGGAVRVESASGPGTTFTVRLPLDSRPAAARVR